MTDTSFYQNPILLNREAHRHTRVLPCTEYGFTRTATSLPVTGAEFIDAGKDFAIVLADSGNGTLTPVVVLGLRQQENLFVDAQGKWEGTYIPAFVRRYPFALADLQGEQTGLCVDQAYAGFNHPQGEPLFDSLGQNAPLLKSALEFLTQHQIANLRTERFCRKLQELDLLTPLNAKVDLFDGSSYVVNGLQVVDERKLAALGDEAALSLFRGGELVWVYAHLLSLPNVNRLVDRLAQRKRAEVAVAA